MFEKTAKKLIKGLKSEKIEGKLAWYAVFSFASVAVFKNWPKLFLWKLNNKHKRIIAELRNGKKFVVEYPADMSIILEIFAEETYDLGGVKNPKTIIDVGAQQGTFSIYCNSKFPNAKIYSYEPLKTSYQNLKKNVQLNKIKNITCTNLGVLDKETKVSFFISKTNNGGHSIHNYDKDMKKITIKTTTLEKIMTKNNMNDCDILKLDCEGSEYKILMNSDDETLSKIKMIVMEVHEDMQKEYTNKDLQGFLKKKGFKVEYIKGEIMVAKKV